MESVIKSNHGAMRGVFLRQLLISDPQDVISWARTSFAFFFFFFFFIMYTLVKYFTANLVQFLPRSFNKF